MDKFLLAENPQIPSDKRKIYIFHTQKPPMLIQVFHEAMAFGSNYDVLTGQYENDGIIETITLQVSALLICEPSVSDELKERVIKVLNKAWHWYTAYLKWEDDQFDKMDNDDN